jgi:hypothetical protein
MLPFCMDFPFCASNADKLPAGLAGTIQAQIVDEERQKPQQIEESYRFPAAIPGGVAPELQDREIAHNLRDAASQCLRNPYEKRVSIAYFE